MTRFRRQIAPLAVILGLGLLVAPRPVFATIYNALDHVDAITAAGWAVELDASGSLERGNTRAGSAGGSGTVGGRRAANVVFLTLSGRYAQESGDAYAADSLAHGRYRYLFTPVWGAEAFLQHEYDRFRRYALRALTGAGGRWRAPTTGPVELALGLAVMHEWIRIAEDPALADSGDLERAVRLSSYADLTVGLGERSSASLLGYLQPRVDDVTDIRALGEASLRAAANDWLGLRVSLSLSWDRTPAQTVEPLDLRGSAGVNFRFRGP